MLVGKAVLLLLLLVGKLPGRQAVLPLLPPSVHPCLPLLSPRPPAGKIYSFNEGNYQVSSTLACCAA